MTSSYPRTFYNFGTFDVIFATASVYVVLNVAVISLRFFSSWKRHDRLDIGDWCGLSATLFTLGMAIVMLIVQQAPWHFRRDGPVVPGFNLGAAAQKKLGFSVALTDCIIDVVMLFLPLYPVLRMNMRGRNKIWVSIVFLLGVFSVTASIVNLATFTAMNIPIDALSHEHHEFIKNNQGHLKHP
ncbi:integral membrane protein [Apiospora phragmitis]|uniref:Integral membrane protein n=1 Tax=Apiospora phragmitis TaxID=2905665 RepID=A0ABR1TB57_9PEZI